MRQQFKVDLPALIQVLSDNLYSSREVAVRELIQNGRDSLLAARRARLISQEDACLRVRSDPRTNEIVFCDNGMGMTAEEAEQNLSVIARSGTRLLRKEAVDTDPELADLFVGQFGLGFLSSLMIADRVTVRSRSRKPGSRPIEWTSEGGQEYFLAEEGSWDQEGTEVRLQLKPAFSRLALPLAIKSKVLHYCDLVEFPIYMDNDSAPVNRMQGPWLDPSGSEEDAVEYLRATGLIAANSEPLFVTMLRDRKGFGGILYLPSEVDEGDIALYVRHIFVRKSTEFITRSLNFVCGVYDCADLPLTLSRESVVEGKTVERLRDKLARDAIRALARTRRQRPRTWERVAAVYDRPLKIAAVKDRQVRDLFAGELDVRLTGGQSMKLSEVAETSRGEIAFIDNVETQSAYGNMLLAQGRPVVDCSDRLDWMLLHLYGQSTNREVQRADIVASDAASHAEGEGWRRLEYVVGQLDDTVDARTVELDADVPALFLKGRQDMMSDMAEQIRAQGKSNEMVETLLGALAELGEGSNRRPLMLNARHPLVQALAEHVGEARDEETLRLVVQALISAARFYTEELDPGEKKDVYSNLSDAFLALLQRGGSPDTTNTPGATSPRRPRA